jgi:hypothetical protein
MDFSTNHCQSESSVSQIAAYLDGQLELPAQLQFETHIEACRTCRTELSLQRQFLCELDSALSTPNELELPPNFARVVSARAASDMSGVRSGGERRRAVVVCLSLAIIAFTLLGATSGRSVLLSVRVLASKVLGILTFIWSTLHDAFVGLTIISRVVVRVVQPQSTVISVLAFGLLVLAVVSLSQLITSYHRRNQMRLFE